MFQFHLIDQHREHRRVVEMDLMLDKKCSAAESTGESTSAPMPVLSYFSNVITRTPISKNWCITEVEKVNFSFIWMIKGFSLRKEKTGEALKSSTFLTDHPNRESNKWRIEISPNKEEKKKCVDIFLVLVSCNQPEVHVQFEFSIINAKGEKAHMAGGSAGTFTDGDAWGPLTFVERDFLLDTANGLLPDDNLTILCEGSIEGVSVGISGHSTGFQVEDVKCTLSENLSSLFESQKFGDITISVGDKDLLVHKAILTARSSVFAAMFTYKMEESQQNRVTIKDIDYEVLREMLIYIYSGKSPNIESQPDRLLAAADKYDLGGLKSMCQEVLCSKMTVENAVDLLVLADSCSAERLKVRANYFINTHVKDIIHTPAWKNMILKYPHLFAESYTALAMK